MKTRCSLYSVAASLVLLLVLCSSAATGVVLRGGSSSCGQWVQDRRADGKPEDSSRFWLMGYMSGLARGTDKDILKDTDSASIILWMENYCRANPLKSVADGADVLFNELEQKIKRK